MLVVDAKVFTGQGASFASAFRVEDGVFTWVGDRIDAPAPAPGEEVVDLGGATVLPGLLDVHTHPALLASLMGTRSPSSRPRSPRSPSWSRPCAPTPNPRTPRTGSRATVTTTRASPRAAAPTATTSTGSARPVRSWHGGATPTPPW